MRIGDDVIAIGHGRHLAEGIEAQKRLSLMPHPNHVDIHMLPFEAPFTEAMVV